MISKLSKFYPVQLEILPILLLLLMLYLTLSNFSALPDRIPTHFNLQGYPDGYGSKNEIFIYPGTGFFFYFLVTGISIAFTLVSNPKDLINLPQKTKDNITPGKAERLRNFLVRCLLVLKLLVIGMVTYLAYQNIQVALSRSSGAVFPWILIFIPLILLVVAYLIINSFRIIFSKTG